MKRYIVVFALLTCFCRADAAWYWPFGDDEESNEPRISELMEPASRLIDSASDFADDGKIDEAVAEYRKALAELERIEIENPQRAEKPEFATVRNKRAYIETSIDSLLLRQAQDNARAVAVTDTTELERKFSEERAAAKAERERKPKEASDRGEDASETARAAALTPEGRKEAIAMLAKDPKSRKARMMLAKDDLHSKRYENAKKTVAGLLAEKPNDSAALNLRALVEMAEGDTASAERTLTQLITSNPRVHYGYYNLARLILATRGAEGKDTARRYYETGRDYCGGPADKNLEESLK